MFAVTDRRALIVLQRSVRGVLGSQFPSLGEEDRQEIALVDVDAISRRFISNPSLRERSTGRR